MAGMGSSEGATPVKGPLRFHFIKSNYFRVIHADGVFGGPSASGNLHISFFNERLPLPVSIEHEISNVGALGAEISRESKDGVVREVEADVVMSLDAAMALHRWLGEKLPVLARVRRAIDEANQSLIDSAGDAQ